MADIFALALFVAGAGGPSYPNSADHKPWLIVCKHHCKDMTISNVTMEYLVGNGCMCTANIYRCHFPDKFGINTPVSHPTYFWSQTAVQ